MRVPVLLAVEDSEADFLIIQLAVNEAPVSVQVHRTVDGEQALLFLHQVGEYQNAPRPDLVLLDWDLPKKTGCDVLVDIQATEALRLLPVVVFTSSEHERDKALALGARDFVVKPSTLDGVIRAIQTICSRMTAGMTA